MLSHLCTTFSQIDENGVITGLALCYEYDKANNRLVLRCDTANGSTANFSFTDPTNLMDLEGEPIDEELKDFLRFLNQPTDK